VTQARESAGGARLDGIQPTSRAKQMVESAVQRIMSVLQTDVTALGMHAPDIHFLLLGTTAIQRMLEQGRLQARGQRPLYEVRWNAELMLVRHRSQLPVKGSACPQNSSAAGRCCLSSSVTFSCTIPTRDFFS
jgi:ribosomal protein S13